jgi:hypothetical protein
VKERVLQQFFEGQASVEDLAVDTVDAFTRRTDSAGTIHSRLHSEPSERELTVTAADVIKLVDAVLERALSLDALDAICFCLEASDSFAWDGDTIDGARVSNALFWLGTPEINYPLSPQVLFKIRHYLLTGERTFSNEDVRINSPRPKLLSVNQSKRALDV